MLVKMKNKSIQRKPQQYHGHTIIELHNHKSGSRERIESDNEFTTGINDFLRDGGYFNNSPFANSDWRGRPMYRNLIGGILLFDSEIEKVNGAYPTIMPAGVKMTANGSFGVTNNANPTEMGSFNSNESSFNSSALTFVYDWTTSQGNGDIACVSLTSDTGGYIGYGNSVSNTRHPSLKELSYDQNVQNAIRTSINAVIGVSMIDGDILYEITAKSTTAFTYSKKKYPIGNVDFFGEFGETHTVSIPSGLVVNNNAPIIICMGNDRFFAIQYKNLSANSTCVVGVYDANEQTWSYINFTIPSTLSGVTLPSYNTVGVVDGEYFTIQQTSTPYTIVRYNWDGTLNTDIGGGYICKLSDNLILGAQWYNNSNSPVQIYDAVNGTLYYTNGKLSTSSMVAFSHDADYKAFITNIYGSGSVNQLYRYRNPLYLATVNNLDNTVVKTTTQTMKVTYTVTPA